MRIISGSAKGRRLATPSGNDRSIRPTSDRAREALFSIIGSKFIHDARVLDLFAGTGALGCEALSRGAAQVLFIDNSRVAIELIQKNISLVPGGIARSRLVKYDLSKGLGPKSLTADTSPFDLVFADPPYQTDLSVKILNFLDNSVVLSEKVLVIIEEKKDVSPPDELRTLFMVDTRKYGDTLFAFYRRRSSELTDNQSD